jgi:membrane protease YdiL (CAAX protease family)
VALVWIGEVVLMVAFLLADRAVTGAGFAKPGGSPVHPLLMVLHCLASSAWTLMVIWFLLCVRPGLRAGEAFRLRPPGILGLSAAAVLGVAMAAIGGLLSARWGSEDTVIGKIGSTPGGLAALGVVAVTLAPVEEFYYRGFVFPALRRYLGGALAVLAVTLWFAAVHAAQLTTGGSGGVDWVSLGCVAFVGMVYTLQRHFSESLVPSMVSHTVYNTTLIIMAAVEMAAG